MDDYVPGDDGYKFLIRRLEDDAVIGFVNLWPEWVHGNAWIGIGIGESANRGKGYGSDAMRLILRFAFAELGLQRVSLGLWVDNLRARRAYENVGFVLEGRVHEVGLRDGQRWDDGVMSVSHLDWLAMQNTK
jgi:RimJ/RimL family protein N-acetyltransferase